MSGEEREQSRTVVAAVAANEIVARMWQEALEDEGIIAALKPTGPGHAFATTALVEHQVLVLEKHAQRAREIISELEAEESAPFDDGESSSG